MAEPAPSGRYPDYDILSKRDTPSWNEQTRLVVDARLGVAGGPVFLSETAWKTLEAVCDCIMPQPQGRARVPLAAYVDRQLAAGKTKGYRFAGMPQPEQAWQRGLAALEEVAQQEQGRPFAQLTRGDQEAMLRRMEQGTLQAAALQGMPARTFWTSHVIHDVLGAYYAHPAAWSEIGWGGPASPRGYVRLGLDARDPWEPHEAEREGDAKAARRNKRVR